MLMWVHHITRIIRRNVHNMFVAVLTTSEPRLVQVAGSKYKTGDSVSMSYL